MYLFLARSASWLFTKAPSWWFISSCYKAPNMHWDYSFYFVIRHYKELKAKHLCEACYVVTLPVCSGRQRQRRWLRMFCSWGRGWSTQLLASTLGAGKLAAAVGPQRSACLAQKSYLAYARPLFCSSFFKATNNSLMFFKACIIAAFLEGVLLSRLRAALAPCSV